MRLLVFLWACLPGMLWAGFGNGNTQFENIVVPLVSSAPEPTIGIPWTTDHVFYHAGSTTLRFIPDAMPGAEWEDVTPPYQVPTNLDPMLVVHEETGRILAGGLLGACSVMMMSDDDGETWIPTANMCSGAQFDHQSVGLGIKPPGFPLAATGASGLNGYYCGQLGEIGCSVSLDGGITWTVPTPAALVSCGGFHGHWRVSPVTGEAFLPVPGCGSQHGLIKPSVLPEFGGVTGLTFEERLVEGSHTWNGGFDSSIGITRESGYLYYGMADQQGARIALSRDEGDTWEKIGPRQEQTWLDVGQFHNPPVIAATFADVQAGDDDRVAFSFIGIEETGVPQIDVHLRSNAIYSCYDKGEGEGDWGGGFPLNQSDMVWHYYVAYSYDQGTTWEVHKISDDPVQVGGVYDSVTDGSGGCRNLLDFNDMDIDSQGRVHIAYADGCTGECAAATPEQATALPGYRDQAPRMFRQISGKGLFAQFDTPEDQADGVTPRGDIVGSSGGGAVGWLTLLVVPILAWRRRMTMV